MASMVISISAWGSEGGGGGFLLFDLAGVAPSFFFFLPKRPPKPLITASEALVGGASVEEELEASHKPVYVPAASLGVVRR